MFPGLERARFTKSEVRQRKSSLFTRCRALAADCISHPVAAPMQMKKQATEKQHFRKRGEAPIALRVRFRSPGASVVTLD